jgi:hypothetical protein
MGKAKKLCAWRPNPATFRPDYDQGVRAEPLVVIVAPNRELAIQIFDQARKFCYRSMLRPCVVYGGAPLGQQIEQLALGCDILIGTPGRLIDFMQRPRNLSLHRLKYMVIDEADEMLHEDWADEMGQILSGGSKLHDEVPFRRDKALTDYSRSGHWKCQVPSVLGYIPEASSGSRQRQSRCKPCAIPGWTCWKHSPQHQAGNLPDGAQWKAADSRSPAQ